MEPELIPKLYKLNLHRLKRCGEDNALTDSTGLAESDFKLEVYCGKAIIAGAGESGRVANERGDGEGRVGKQNAQRNWGDDL